MKKIFFTAISACILLLATSCTTQKELYSWGGYEVRSYNYLKNNDEKATLALIESYRNIIDKQDGTRGVVPPGIYADYGLILIHADKAEEGKEMLLKETELYPESQKFIDRILKMIEQ